MTQAKSQRIVSQAILVEAVWAQLEVAQSIIDAQRDVLREAAAELRNIAQNAAVEGD